MLCKGKLSYFDYYVIALENHYNTEECIPSSIVFIYAIKFCYEVRIDKKH